MSCSISHYDLSLSLSHSLSQSVCVCVGVYRSPPLTLTLSPFCPYLGSGYLVSRSSTGHDPGSNASEQHHRSS